MRPAWPAGRSCHFSPRYSAICCSESASSSLCSVSRVRPWQSPQKLSCRSRTNTSNRCVLFLIRIGCRLLYRRFCCSSQQNLHPLSFYTLKITSPCRWNWKGTSLPPVTAEVHESEAAGTVEEWFGCGGAPPGGGGRSRVA